jgi:hypothetical protein
MDVAESSWPTGAAAGLGPNMSTPPANPKKGVTWPDYFADTMTTAKEGEEQIGVKTVPVEKEAVAVSPVWCDIPVSARDSNVMLPKTGETTFHGNAQFLPYLTIGCQIVLKHPTVS